MTRYAHDAVAWWPTTSVAVTVAVRVPSVVVSSATLPLVAPAIPDDASDADHGTEAALLRITSAGQAVKPTTGGSASTRTVAVVGSETFPAASAAVPVTVWLPLVVNVVGAVNDATPLPGLPSGSAGSVDPKNVTVTVSLNQPP